MGWGEIVGIPEGVLDGAGEVVGLELGVVVGFGVAKRSQALDVASIQVGLNESNCSIVSNIEENGQRTPLLLLTKFSSFSKVFPKTTTSDDPTKLSLKHVFRMFTGPSDSTI